MLRGGEGKVEPQWDKLEGRSFPLDFTMVLSQMVRE
jgi:hypothetical protein